jgi:hypothetical protein
MEIGDPLVKKYHDAYGVWVEDPLGALMEQYKSEMIPWQEKLGDPLVNAIYEAAGAQVPGIGDPLLAISFTPPVPPVTTAILLESGDTLLKEDGGDILMESA